jgi:hypothetical protein
MAPTPPKQQGNRHTKQAPHRLGKEPKQDPTKKHTPPKRGAHQSAKPAHHTTQTPPHGEAQTTRQTKMASTTWHTVEFSKSGRASPKTLKALTGGNRSNLPDQPHTVNHTTSEPIPIHTPQHPTTDQGRRVRHRFREPPTGPATTLRRADVRSSLAGGETQHYAAPSTTVKPSRP